jgi:hypothetical protein
MAAKRILKARKQKALNVLEFQYFADKIPRQQPQVEVRWIWNVSEVSLLPALENLLEMITNFTQITLSPRQSPFLTFRKNTS